MNFADQLISAVRNRGNSLCVGLDPRLENLPPELWSTGIDQNDELAAQAFEEFCTVVIDQVSDIVPIVKPQSAFFEALGPAGVFLHASQCWCQQQSQRCRNPLQEDEERQLERWSHVP